MLTNWAHIVEFTIAAQTVLARTVWCWAYYQLILVCLPNNSSTYKARLLTALPKYEVQAGKPERLEETVVHASGTASISIRLLYFSSLNIYVSIDKCHYSHSLVFVVLTFLWDPCNAQPQSEGKNTNLLTVTCWIVSAITGSSEHVI
jgi:hypothetical protein